MAPLGDAVRFIDDEHGNIDALHEGREEFVFQAFRRDVDQFHPARTDGSEAGLRLFKGTLAFDIRLRYLLIDQAVDGSWKQIDLPAPVGMMARQSLPSRRVWMTSCWPGRNDV